MKEQFNLSEYINNGVENIIKGILKASFKNHKETAFIIKFIQSAKEAKKKRESSNTENLPAFLISSITSKCNLFCTGCYARENKSCGEDVALEQLTADRWGSLFEEASNLGITFILLAGGEPLMRRDVLEKAAKIKEIMFPVFTNGTLLNETYIELFDKNRNLIPILSIEGEKELTDDRRGAGTFETILKVMDALKKKKILFGVSVTMTTENIHVITNQDFVHKLYENGCKAFIFVEYVPLDETTKVLAPTELERRILETEQQKLRGHYEDVIFLSFPGDEKYSGGCLAAGRGFFHINVDGAAEPCPFSPYSDINLKDSTLKEALNSPFFGKLKDTGMLMGEHDGGCLLFQKEKEVIELLKDA